MGILDVPGYHRKQVEDLIAAAGDTTTLPAVSGVAIEDRRVLVLCLHHEDPTAIIRAGLRRGVTFITARELVEGRKGKRLLPAYPVLLTFDDAYASNMTVVHPVLQQYGVKATLFLPSGHLDGTLNTDSLPMIPGAGGPMTWNDARTLRDSGLWDIQNHTENHVRVWQQTPAARAASIKKCSDRIEQELGIRPNTLAYPGGGLYRDWASEMAALGIEMGFAAEVSSEGYNEPSLLSQNPYTVHRLMSDTTAGALAMHRDTLIYDFERDGDPKIGNATNALGYWELPSGGGFSGEHGTYSIYLGGASQTMRTADLFRVRRNEIVWTYFESKSTGAGAAVRLLQYDRAKAALPAIDLKTYGTAADWSTTDVEVRLADEARYVRLELSTPGGFAGSTLQVARGRVEVIP